MDEIQKHIEFCISKANDMADFHSTLAKEPLRFPRSVDDFQKLCEKKTSLKISVETVGIPVCGPGISTTVRAAFLKEKDGYKISMKPEPNICWRRFIQCKELFHVVLDQSQYCTMQIFQHIQRWVVQIPGRTSLPTPATISELMAEISAMEYLFPYIERVSKRKTLMTKDDYLEVAKIYKVPSVLVESYLSELSMEYLGEISRR